MIDRGKNVCKLALKPASGFSQHQHLAQVQNYPWTIEERFCDGVRSRVQTRQCRAQTAALGVRCCVLRQLGLLGFSEMQTESKYPWATKSCDLCTGQVVILLRTSHQSHHSCTPVCLHPLNAPPVWRVIMFLQSKALPFSSQAGGDDRGTYQGW